MNRADSACNVVKKCWVFAYEIARRGGGGYVSSESTGECGKTAATPKSNSCSESVGGASATVHMCTFLKNKCHQRPMGPRPPSPLKRQPLVQSH
jgi:hypothetical protein